MFRQFTYSAPYLFPTCLLLYGWSFTQTLHVKSPLQKHRHGHLPACWCFCLLSSLLLKTFLRSEADVWLKGACESGEHTGPSTDKLQYSGICPFETRSATCGGGEWGREGGGVFLLQGCVFSVQDLKVLTKINIRVCPLKKERKNMTAFLIVKVWGKKMELSMKRKK